MSNDKDRTKQPASESPSAMATKLERARAALSRAWAALDARDAAWAARAAGGAARAAGGAAGVAGRAAGEAAWAAREALGVAEFRDLLSQASAWLDEFERLWPIPYYRRCCYGAAERGEAVYLVEGIHHDGTSAVMCEASWYERLEVILADKPAKEYEWRIAAIEVVGPWEA
jgi:hypothetical protein